MSQITILLLYLLAAAAFTLHRLPKYASRRGPLLLAACLLTAVGIGLHAQFLFGHIGDAGSVNLSVPALLSIIALQLASIALLGAIEATLRGMAAGLLLLAGIGAAALDLVAVAPGATPLTWQMHAHVLVSVFAYGLLTAGAIVALFALIQDRRLRAGRLSPGNQLFAPLETTEKLLFAITAAGFAALLIAVMSGVAFVENLFAQHLAHKTILSLVALLLFGVLLGGRLFAGWRGRRAVYLYLGGFLALGLAYFGSRFVLEQILDRSWG